MQRHDAVILAAGGSRRLGRIKQNLTIGGETLLARTRRLVASTRPERLIVVLGAFADTLAAQLPDGDVLINARWASGMASSLRRASDALEGRALPVLVTVVDQPALSEAHLQALLAAYDGECDVVSAYGPIRGVPVVLRPATMRRASSLEGDRGFRELWRTGDVRSVRDDGLVQDLDTEDDVLAAIRGNLLDPVPTPG
ncbi:NTP transferase domain-containing protein [Luteibacter sp. CQ10]|uniref:nucleotidyltransferase family protein n=1 Tax=Luteibacter sp. CQ10 TaxID=2805821 RepID=UPI0034A1A9C8